MYNIKIYIKIYKYRKRCKLVAVLTAVTETLDATTPKQSLDCLKKTPSFLNDFINTRTLSTSGISTNPLRKERGMETAEVRRVKK